jgi:hypothetical protein
MLMKDKKQIGGTHYSNLAIQPTEYAQKNNLTFIEGNIVKYVTRHRHKNGKEDLMKALHYLQQLIEYEYPEKKTEIPYDIEYFSGKISVSG